MMGEVARIYQALGADIVFVVLMAGFWLGVTAFYVPGTGLVEAGALGGLLVGGLGLLFLPVNLAGLLLLLVALGCFAALLLFRHSAIFFVAGFAFQILGSVYLFQAAARPAGVTILVVNTVALAYHQLVLRPGLYAQDRASPLDPDTLVGQDAVVEATIDPLGTVRLGGVIWSATAEDIIEAGRPVRVIGRDGLYLHVVPVEEAKAEPVLG